MAGGQRLAPALLRLSAFSFWLAVQELTLWSKQCQGEGGQQHWDCGGDNRDDSCVPAPLLNSGKFIPWKVGIVTLKLCALDTGA